MNRAKKIAPWILILAYMLAILPLISAHRKQIKCEKIAVIIADGTQHFFVEEQNIISMLHDKGEKIIGESIHQLDLNRLEGMLKLHPSINNVNIYGKVNGELQINIEQRNPILRVINRNRESYYIDEKGALMPLSDKYSAHVLVASGDLNEPYSKRYTRNLRAQTPENVDNSGSLLLDLYQLAEYIYHDEFWRAQIEQIYVKGNAFEMVPRVGTHIIEFGTIENYEKKFRNLRALYLKGLPETGWNKYKTVNLKYNNQVICTKR